MAQVGSHSFRPSFVSSTKGACRDMPDVQSASCLFPTDRDVKVILYLHDLPAVSPAFFLYEKVLEVLLRV